MSTNETGYGKAVGETAHGPSVGTIVWGAIVIAIAGLLASSRLGWFTIDPGVAAVVVLLIAGVGLVIGGSLAAARSRKSVEAGTREDEAKPRNPYENPYQTPSSGTGTDHSPGDL
jgi:hypothetical protein